MSVRTPMGAWTSLAREPRRPEATPRARPRRLCTALDLREGGVIPPAEEEWVDSEFPMIAAEDRGDVRVAWMDNRTGRWNTWYRPSADGGRTWSGSVRLSDRPDGAPYKSSRGFRYPYGDY